MSTPTQQKQGKQPKTISGWVTAYRSQIEKALPAHIGHERFVRMLVTAANSDPKLQQADPVSFMGAAIRAAQYGLEVDVAGQAYLVPFWNREKQVYEVNFIPGYRGLVQLVYRSGKVTGFDAHIVYEGDHYRIQYGLDPVLEHVPARPDTRGEPTAVYAVARIAGPNGKPVDSMFEWMWMEDVEAIRERSKAGKGPWQTDYQAMARKTAARQLVKWLPMATEVQQVAARDEQFDAGIAEANRDWIEGEAKEAEPQAGGGGTGGSAAKDAVTEHVRKQKEGGSEEPPPPPAEEPPPEEQGEPAPPPPDDWQPEGPAYGGDDAGTNQFSFGEE